MKFKNIALYFGFLISACCFSLGAKEAPEVAEDAVVEEKIIPTEISEPPYEVGQLPTKQGFYIEREEQTTINYRIVGNRMRVYWIDEDGLIAEPEATEGIVRFTGNTKLKKRNDAYFKLSTLDTGLGSPRIVRAPHVFNVVLILKNAEGVEIKGAVSEETKEVHTFRYVIAMDKVVEAEVAADAEPKADSAY